MLYIVQTIYGGLCHTETVCDTVFKIHLIILNYRPIISVAIHFILLYITLNI